MVLWGMENHLTMDKIFKNIVEEVTHKMFKDIDTAAQIENLWNVKINLLL